VDFDLVVIGAGPGGYVAAIRAAQLGLKTAIVERDKLGGICLNWGCIPTKALLKSAETFETLGHLEDYGLRAEKVGFDLDAVVARSRKVAGQLNAGVAFLMKKNKITVIEGEARLEAGAPAPLVRVALKAGGEQVLKAANVLLATGARARTLPDLGLAPDGERVWSYREAMVPDRVPTSLLVVGSGAIGIEFASFFRALGSEVTVIEALPRILPVEDEEVSAAAQKAFQARGIAFRTGASVRRLARSGKGVELTVEAGGVTIEKTHVATDSHGFTGVPGLWAVGDLAGPPWLAHKASHEGVHCVEHIAGLKPSGLTAPIPGCTYASPQIASVGLTEAQAKAKGLEIKVGRFPLRANGKAIAAGQTEGFVKTVFDAATGALVGAHMIGADVTEMIQGYALAMTLEATEADLFATVFPHPTISEGMHEAALDAFGRALHV